MEKLQLPQGFPSFLSFYDYAITQDPKILEGDDSSLVTYFNHGNKITIKLIELKARCFDEMAKNRPHIQDVIRVEQFYREVIRGNSHAEDSKIFKRLFDLATK